MSAALFSGIDWTSPWLAPFRDLAAPILQTNDWCGALNERAADSGLRNHRGLPIRFVPQASLPPGMAYEAYISETGEVPTRENLHDFFNALVWLTFPRIKVRLNALQAAEIQKFGEHPDRGKERGSGRGKIRDAATLFDENAALLIVRETGLLEQFRAHHWQDIFVTQRELFGRRYDVCLFGHALMDKLSVPYKAITAHAWPVLAGDAFFETEPAERLLWLDETVACQLEIGLTTACFTPLPILGIPGWWGGQDLAFYADTSVFRPKRQK